MEFGEMTIPEMIRTYNQMVLKAQEMGLQNYHERKAFHDRSDGIKHLEAFASSLKAFVSGQKAEGGPGLARMQQNLGPEKTEEIRSTVVAEQQKALAEVAGPKQESEVSKKQIKIASKRGRAPAFGPDQHIELVTHENPKREGTAGHKAYSYYRTGMRVDTFIEKVGDAAEAYSHLRWDVAKGFIKIK